MSLRYTVCRASQLQGPHNRRVSGKGVPVGGGRYDTRVVANAAPAATRCPGIVWTVLRHNTVTPHRHVVLEFVYFCSLMECHAAVLVKFISMW